ncbi:hypothetical protein CONLIGDRAFT_635336 [Coniochaeta ligniaria NRRL 30616]|uniref:JmjC domain-containing protein n=1 Tax=Coniochaeta ligniaria NRRL 30616 TaxID=1408157 RepID=A0A1J7J8L8_9PEZI|nr:hypothetical protein CONLIGDRAFT_635336 [Coniochaeta ligniaria NRRL 30616]
MAGHKDPKIRWYDAKSQMAHTMDDFRDIINSATVGTPLTRDQFLHHLAAGVPFPRGSYLVLSGARESDVRSLVHDFELTIPILVRHNQHSTRNVSFAETRKKLVGLGEQHVYTPAHERLDRKTGKALWLPQVLPCSVWDGMVSEQRPINILSLPSQRDRPVPAWLEDDPDYRVLRDVPATESATELDPRHREDSLSKCREFGLFATAGVYSMPHVDRHGVITTARCEEGTKLWLLWSALPMDVVAEWAASNDPPADPAAAIVMEDGDILIMPPGTPHAPYSVTNVNMNGTMHWSKRTMLRSGRICRLEIDWPEITNEEPAPCLVEKLTAVAGRWHKSVGDDGWPSSEELHIFEELVEEIIQKVREKKEREERENLQRETQKKGKRAGEKKQKPAAGGLQAQPRNKRTGGMQIATRKKRKKGI